VTASRALTVEDLLSRYGPASVVVDDPEPRTVPLSVSGRPRPPARPPRRFGPLDLGGYDEDAPERRSSALATRWGAVAAGVLLAAGSAVGVAVVQYGATQAGGARPLDDGPAVPDRDRPR
jgi:hypothetical protein